MDEQLNTQLIYDNRSNVTILEETKNEIMNTNFELYSTVQSFLQLQQKTATSIENLTRNQKSISKRVNQLSVKKKPKVDQIEPPQNVSCKKLKKSETFSAISNRLCRYSDDSVKKGRKRKNQAENENKEEMWKHAAIEETTENN